MRGKLQCRMLQSMYLLQPQNTLQSNEHVNGQNISNLFLLSNVISFENQLYTDGHKLKIEKYGSTSIVSSVF